MEAVDTANYLNSTIFNYLNTSISTSGWVFWFLILLFVLFLLWLFFGGGDYEYIGLAPMKIGVDSTKYANGYTYAAVDKSNRRTKKITDMDLTPKIPDDVSAIRDSERDQNTTFTSSITDNRVNSNVILMNNITSKYSKEQRSKALGIYKEYKTNRISKGEMKCKEIIEDIYGVPFFCVRPNFLKNPETKRNLELDLYNDDLKIAIERNGIQHYVWPNYTSNTKEQFINQLRRDKFKYEQCNDNGIYLITVPYTVELDEIENYIRDNLPKKVTYIDNNFDISDSYPFDEI